jgi:hypothetical protein
MRMARCHDSNGQIFYPSTQALHGSLGDRTAKAVVAKSRTGVHEAGEEVASSVAQVAWGAVAGDDMASKLED